MHVTLQAARGCSELPAICAAVRSSLADRGRAEGLFLWLKQEKAKGTRSQLNGRDSSGGRRLRPPEVQPKTLKQLGISKQIDVRAGSSSPARRTVRVASETWRTV